MPGNCNADVMQKVAPSVLQNGNHGMTKRVGEGLDFDIEMKFESFGAKNGPGKHGTRDAKYLWEAFILQCTQTC